MLAQPGPGVAASAKATSAAGNKRPSAAPAQRKVLVVAEPGRESAGALQWVLSHAILEQDDLILLHIEAASSRRTSSFSAFLRRNPSATVDDGSVAAAAAAEAYPEFVEGMKTKCHAAQPRIKVQVERLVVPELAETNANSSASLAKANAILNYAKATNTELLVIGQRRHSSFLGGKLGGSMGRQQPEVAEYLIENSKCLCVGVQKKGQNSGYVLNTKTHKNFWLLA